METSQERDSERSAKQYESRITPSSSVQSLAYPTYSPNGSSHDPFSSQLVTPSTSASQVASTSSLTPPERVPDDQDDTPRLTRSHRQRILSGNSPSPEPERPSALPSNGSQHDERAKAFPRHLDFSPRDSPPAGSPASSSSQYPADSPLYTSSRLASPKDEADDAGSAGSRYSEEVEQNSDGNSSELSWRGIDYPNNSPPKSALLSQEFERLEGMGLFDPFAEDGEVDRIPDFGTAAKAPGNRVSDGELSNWMRRPAGSEQGSPKKLQGGGNWWDQAGDFNPGEGNQNWELLRDENGKDSSHENRSHTVEDVSPSQVGLVLQGIPSETVHVAKPQPSSYQPRRPSGSATPPASYTPDPIGSPAQGHRPLSSPAASSQVSLSLDTNLPPVVNIVRQPQISSTRSSSRASSHRLSTSLNYASQPTTPISQAPPDLASVLESPRNPAVDDPPSPPLGPSITAVLHEPRPFENSVHTQEYFAPIVPETEPARARSPLKERASKKERSSTLPILSAKSTRRSPVLANPTSREAPPEIPPSSKSTATSTLGLDLSPNSGGMSASRLSSASDFADAYGNFTNDDDMAMYSPIQAPPVDPPLDATAPQFREFAHSSENSNLSIIEELDAQLSEAIQNIDFGSPSTSLADHQQFVPTLVLPQPSSLGSDETHPREGGPPSSTTLVEAPSTTPARTDAKARAVAFIEDLKRARAAAALQLASTPSPPLPPEAPPKAPSIDPERSTPDSSMDMTPRATPAVEHFSSSKSPLAPESPLPRLPSATGTGGGGSTLGASHALQTVTATLSPPRTSGTPPISRKRLLPLATHTQDLRQARTSAERSRLYASKIESLMRADSGLCSWSSFIRDRKSPQVTVASIRQNQHPRAEPSHASTVTFPARPGDTFQAREIPRGQFGSQDLLPTVPYPGVLQANIHGSVSTGNLSGRYLAQGFSKTPSILGGRNSFFSNLGRKGSKRSAPPLSSSPSSFPPLSPPIQYSPSTLSSTSSRPSGPRMPGVHRLSFDGAASVRASSPIVYSPMKSLSPLPSVDPAKLQRVVDILPDANREELEALLKEVNGDEVLAISAYLGRSK